MNRSPAVAPSADDGVVYGIHWRRGYWYALVIAALLVVYPAVYERTVP